MASRVHGIFSLILFSVAVGIGFFSMAAESMTLGLIYLGVAAFSVPVMIYSFCTKCCQKGSCGHVFPGLLAKRLPPRTGAYTKWDILGVVLPAGTLLLMPQTWLLKDAVQFTVFWLLVAAAGAEINLFVCRICSNRACPLFKC
jgi:Na+-transporting methylmalonyl-CoA/oxaloacetate decarboxylase beta subunit